MLPRSTLLLTAALVVGLAACAHPAVTQTGEGSVGDQSRRDPSLAGVSCAFAAGRESPSPAPSTQPLPRDFAPVTARRCTLSNAVVAGDGEWQVRDEQEATGGLDGLVAALRQPSAQRTDGPCPAIAVAPIELTLVDVAGRTLHPTVPQDACGFPARAVTAAVAALPWKSVKQTKVARVRSQLELDSGCSGSYKPVVDLVTAKTQPRSLPPVFGASVPAELTVCRYRLDPSTPISLDHGPLLASGALESAGTLRGANLARLVALADAAAPVSGPCDQPQQPFAVLAPTGGNGPSLAVELGGCRRLLDGENQLRQLDAATVALVTA